MSKDNKIDQELVRQLAVILNETDLTEIEVEQGDLHIRVARNITMSVAAPVAQPAMAAPAMQAAPTAVAEAPQAAESKGHVVKSPMVGTAYLAPEPGADEFVKVGDTVTAGQTILIVEAMKHMNQISADRAGKVTEIFVESGQPVEYGEPLLTLE
ncbi:acetyl-CoA carboxylase biotin carboxyl carrier protein [Pararhizobium sp. IMCC21322]|uniref:acetyl-CoA carboxylase biotin carboxyl carrier protein n=1 Tax=Pararhizobium sp. IMCC21322 TaxID=3067903 RepID=UPI0027427B2A|nr:acetyl-CoA carboxylase biotin carboxyl carrier protein [Pararhizobium sp. IMCC21322]